MNYTFGSHRESDISSQTIKSSTDDRFKDVSQQPYTGNTLNSHVVEKKKEMMRMEATTLREMFEARNFRTMRIWCLSFENLVFDCKTYRSSRLDHENGGGK